MPNQIVPSMKELDQWFRDGVTPREAQKRLAERGYHLATGTLAVQRWRMGHPPLRLSHKELIPWRVLPEHSGLWEAQMLRAESTRRQGGTVPESRLRYLDGWLAKLDEQDLVIHYDRDTEQGWFKVPRRPGIDKDIIRDPAVP